MVDAKKNNDREETFLSFCCLNCVSFKRAGDRATVSLQISANV